MKAKIVMGNQKSYTYIQESYLDADTAMFIRMVCL